MTAVDEVLPTAAPLWTGGWVSDRLDLTLRTHASPVGLDLTDLVGLAVRRNPRRAHLLVSRVLGKHVPTDPRVVRGAGLLLGALVRQTLGAPAPGRPVGSPPAAPTATAEPTDPTAAAEPTDPTAAAEQADPAAAAEQAVLAAAGALLRAALDGAPDAPARLVGALAPAATPARAVVLGYAETATALGHCVADALGGAPYLHSTRRPVDGVPSVGAFEEEHSHATTHLLLPADPALLSSDAPLVLVDDELSTGTTALNTIEALHRLAVRDRYVVAALVDLRTDADRERTDALARRLGTRIDVVALAAGGVAAPDDVLTRGAALVRLVDGRGDGDVDAPVRADEPATGEPGPTDGPRGGVPATGEPPSASDGPRDGVPATGEARSASDGPRDGVPATGEARSASDAPRDVAGVRATVRRVDVGWPGDLPESARHGVTSADGRALDAWVGAGAAALATALAAPAAADPDRESPLRVLVLGTEELMHAPLRLAAALADAVDDRAQVRFSTTTRSPVLAVDDPSYAIRSALTFPAHDAPDDAAPGDSGHRRFAYNVADRFDAVVVVTDAPGDTDALHARDGLLDVLGAQTRDVVLVVLPDAAAHRARRTAPLPEPLRGPQFGSYAPDEVAWLLTDLSGVALEAPVEEREEAIQSGGAHYAESLPVEYQPSESYARLFDAALAEGARRMAHAVGVVAEQLLDARGHDLTLVSLARAGTPVGILVRRWARLVHGLDVPHYAASIVRGRGIDDVALRYVAAHHDPRSVAFVDGWTGKGAIARELDAALADHEARTGTAFPRDLAVLADPGRCVRLAGTRDDFLVPSACLNSTVSGLVSRTVLNRDLLTPEQFHGAKFYAELADADVSVRFLDVVAEQFADVRADVERDWRRLADEHATVDWAGWAAVERIVQEYGIGDVNLVKPGVGETTRVLLRRVPWRVLVRPDAAPADVAHVRHLAAERGVPVETVDDLPYSVVGLIHPRFTAGATGADGRTVAAHGGAA